MAAVSNEPTEPDGTAPAGPRLTDRHGWMTDYKVSSLELFFDLVFVFALTQVTGLLAEDLTWAGMLRGIAVLAMVWWAWVGYAWLTNSIPIEDDDRSRIVVLLAMVAMLIVGLSIPHAFGNDGILFGLSYLVVVLLFLTLYAVSARNEPDLLRAIRKLTPGVSGGPDPDRDRRVLRPGSRARHAVGRRPADHVHRTVGLGHLRLAGSAQPLRRASRLGRDHRPGRVAGGPGRRASSVPISSGLLVAAGLGVAVVATMWWLYFDVVSLAAERRLHQLTGAARNALARDAYSYIHGLMVLGIVFVALGLKKAMFDLGDPMKPVPAVALLGGLAVYLLGHLLFRLRNIGSLNVARAVAAVVLLALIPVALAIPALSLLLVVTGVMFALVAYEGKSYAAIRQQLRHPETSAS